MKVFERILEAFGVIGIVLGLAWWFVPTAAVVTVTNLQYSSSQIVFSRSVPFNVWLEWATEVKTPLRECHAAGSALIQRGTETVMVTTPPPLVSCLQEPGPKSVSNEFVAKVLGIRLRPLYPPTVVIQQ